MIAVDTNILVYAHRQDSPRHDAAQAALQSLALEHRRWAVPWPCVHEFLAIVTHPRIYRPPTEMPDALATITALSSLPGLTMISETPRHTTRLSDLLNTSGATGPKVHDARIAAICLDHGVSELWTADRDFSFFPELRTSNPLVKQ